MEKQTNNKPQERKHRKKRRNFVSSRQTKTLIFHTHKTREPTGSPRGGVRTTRQARSTGTIPNSKKRAKRATQQRAERAFLVTNFKSPVEPNTEERKDQEFARTLRKKMLRGKGTNKSPVEPNTEERKVEEFAGTLRKKMLRLKRRTRREIGERRLSGHRR